VSLLVYMDGEYVPQEQAKVSVFDHGFLYGDGVFEGIRAYKGRVFKLEEHLARLYRSAKAIMLQIPLNQEEMREAVLESLRRNELSDAYIRLVVTRGKGDLGLDPRKCTGGPSIVIIADKIALYPQEMYEQGLEVITVVTRRNFPQAVNPAIKSLNYLNNIVAKLEVIQAHLLEGIMLSHEGYVAEATGDNVFIYQGGKLVTPPAHVGILEGITRNAVMELAAELGIPTVEELFNQYEMYTADECFLTGTAAEIMPVVRVDGRVIGDGTPGPVTNRLIERFREETVRNGVAIWPERGRDLDAVARP
jgi:branched-chain amino acid aminotransferase